MPSFGDLAVETDCGRINRQLWSACENYSKQQRQSDSNAGPNCCMSTSMAALHAYFPIFKRAVHRQITIGQRRTRPGMRRGLTA